MLEADMTKALIMFRKRSDLARTEFLHYWRETHGPIACKMPGLRRYVQDHVIVEPTQVEPAFDAIAELWFDSVESFQASMASPEGQTTLADAASFADMESVRVVLADEVTIV